MENQQAKKYIKIFGWIIFLSIFVISGFCRIFFRDYYSKEKEESVLLILYVLGIVYLILRFIFDKENFIEEVKPVKNQIIKRWPEILVITLMLLLWFYSQK